MDIYVRGVQRVKKAYLLETFTLKYQEHELAYTPVDE
jgi:hypothetical protein